MKLLRDYDPDNKSWWLVKRSKAGTVVIVFLSLLLVCTVLITDMSWQEKLQCSVFVLAIATVSLALYIRKRIGETKFVRKRPSKNAA